MRLLRELAIAFGLVALIILAALVFDWFIGLWLHL